MILRLSASADVRSDIAIRRHQALVSYAYSFCWAAWSAHPPPSSTTPPAPGAGGGEGGSRARRAAPPPPCWPRAIRAVRAWLAPGDRAAALVAGMVQGAPAPAAPGPDDIPRGGPRPAPLTSRVNKPPARDSRDDRRHGRHLQAPPPWATSRLPPRPAATARGPGPEGPPRPGQSGALLFAPKAGSSPLTRGRCKI
jgi:hypothetical protein